MFSYFKNGITDTTPHKTIDLPGLIKLIKNNPQKTLIEVIRNLRIVGNEEFKVLKRKLPNITPNCMVKRRSLENANFELNFKESSQYIYFDTDDILNVDEYKQYFIKKYGHLVSMVCKSSSCGGLSILFKITNKIASKEQFFQVWDEIRTTILKDEIIDLRCKDIGRVMYISYDPEVYCNYENEISVCLVNNTDYDNKKGIKQPISGRGVINTLNDTFYEIIPYNQLLDKINLKTSVYIDKPVVEMIPVDFTEVTFPKNISDNNKHRVYTGMIHSLVNLNPDLAPDYLFSYINFINNHFAYPSMEFKKLGRLFNFVYNSIKNDKNYNYSKKRTKWVHFNKQSLLTGDEKKDIASKLNGKRRCNDSIKRIQLAKEYLISTGQKVTRKSVAELASLSIATVKRHFDKEPTDLNELLSQLNSIPGGTNKNVLREGYSTFSTVLPESENINPDCPRLCLEYILTGKTA